jgi:hypothetical protein
MISVLVVWGMRNVSSHHYRLAWRASRRRNCLTETTRTRFRRAIAIKSRSRLRSSSRVTRYVALPRIAASRISSSSGSRQAFSSPGVSINVARATISLINRSASPGGYLNLLQRRGRLRTSASSVSCDIDVTAVNWSRIQAATTCPGGPEGLRKAETQTLVSSRATSGTTVCFDLGPRFGDLRFGLSLRDSFGPAIHPAQQPLQLVSPAPRWVKRDDHLGFFFQPQRAKRFEHTFFEDGFERLVHGRSSFG